MAEAAEVITRLHNRPPVTEIFRLENEQLPANLEADNKALLKRRDELLAAVSRCPDKIEDDETAGRVTDFVKQLGACIKTAEAKRQGDKEPTLQSGRIIDGFFKKGIIDPVDAAKRAIENRLTLYLRHKAEVERRRREEEERKAREAAAQAAREAAEREAKIKDEAGLAAAISAEEEAAMRQADAAKAAQAAEAKNAELSRTRGDFGALASLRTEWVGEVDEVTPGTLTALAAFIGRDAIEKALRLAIRNGIREVPGCRIFERTAATVR